LCSRHPPHAHARARTEQGIPTIHYRWLLHSAEQGCPLPYRPYLLPAGVSLIDEKRIFQYVHLYFVLGPWVVVARLINVRALCVDSHESWPMAVFAGVSIKILGSRQFMVRHTTRHDTTHKPN
jgi:hypothetical protein